MKRSNMFCKYTTDAASAPRELLSSFYVEYVPYGTFGWLNFANRRF
jgi:hypothetical protein